MISARRAKQFFALSSGLAIAACANNRPNAAALPGQPPVVLPVEAGTPQGECEAVSVAAVPSGCAGTWRCGEPAPRTFLCAQTDAGRFSCACTQGDASTTLEIDGGCSTSTQISALARTLCGWDVP